MGDCYANNDTPMSLFEQPSETRCSGHRHCRARVHVHGCYADHGACDDPTDHAWFTASNGSRSSS